MVYLGRYVGRGIWRGDVLSVNSRVNRKIML